MITSVNLFIGIVSGIVASGIFFLTLLLVRPKITVSNQICYDGESLYRIKVVNRTKAMLKNLNYTLQCYETRGDGIFYLKDIKPYREKEFYIDKYDRKDENASYAIRFSYEIPEECFLNDTNKLVFTFLADHTYSNTSVCIKKEYFIKKEGGGSDIVTGIFETGLSTKILR